MHRITQNHLLSAPAFRVAGLSPTNKVVSMFTRRSMYQMRGSLQLAQPDQWAGVVRRATQLSRAQHAQTVLLSEDSVLQQSTRDWLHRHHDVLESDPGLKTFSAWDLAQPFGDGYYLFGMIETARHRPAVRDVWQAFTAQRPMLPDEEVVPAELGLIDYFTADELTLLARYHPWDRSDILHSIVAFKTAALASVTYGEEPASEHVAQLIASTARQRLHYGASILQCKESPYGQEAFIANTLGLRAYLVESRGLELAEHATIDEVRAQIPMLRNYLRRVSHHEHWRPFVYRVAAEDWPTDKAAWLLKNINTPHRVALRGMRTKTQWINEELCNFAAASIIHARLLHDVHAATQAVFGKAIEHVMWAPDAIWRPTEGRQDFAKLLAEDRIDLPQFQISQDDGLRDMRSMILTAPPEQMRMRLARLAMTTDNVHVAIALVNHFAQVTIGPDVWLDDPGLIAATLQREDIAPEAQVEVWVDADKVSWLLDRTVASQPVARMQFAELQRWAQLVRLRSSFYARDLDSDPSVLPEERLAIRRLLAPELTVTSG